MNNDLSNYGPGWNVRTRSGSDRDTGCQRGRSYIPARPSGTCFIDDCTRLGKASTEPLIEGRGLRKILEALKLVILSNRPSPMSFHTSSPCAVALTPMAGRECRFLVFSSWQQGLLLASDVCVRSVQLLSSTPDDRSPTLYILEIQCLVFQLAVPRLKRWTAGRYA